MNVISVSDLRWNDSEHKSFDALVDFEGLGAVQFTARPDDVEDHTLEIWDNAVAGDYGNIAEYAEPEPEPVIIVIPSVTLWERMTEAEAEQVAEVMATQSVRTVQIFNNATTFRSDHELWPLLEQIANDLFGQARATELLAP